MSSKGKQFREMEQARREGMQYALKVAKEKGVEGLEQDLKLRGNCRLPIAICNEVVVEEINNIKSMTIDTILAMAVLSLNWEFGFGQKRLARFRDRFMGLSERLVSGEFNWEDVLTQIKMDTGMDFEIRMNLGVEADSINHVEVKKNGMH